MWRSASNKPVLQQDLIGNAKDGYAQRSMGFVLWRRTATVQNQLVTLWDGPTGLYAFPASAQQMRLVSTNAWDADAGTGIRKVMVHYLDSNYLPHEEIVTLNGTTPVNMAATDVLRINRLHAWEVWSNVVALWTVSLTNLAWSVTYSLISAGLNSSRQAVYTVPAGMTGYISHWQASSGSTGNHFCTTVLSATQHEWELLAWTFLAVDEAGTQNGGVSVNLPITVKIPAKADVQLAAQSDAVNANVTAIGAIMGWFETN